MADTKEQYTKQLSALEKKMESYRVHWKSIRDYLLPRYGLYLSSTTQDVESRGKRKDEKILNGTPKEALKRLASGLYAGLTPATTPWFAMTIDDEELKEVENVKVWLHEVRNTMLSALSQSNFYDVISGTYTEIAAFGTTALVIEEDFDSIVRFKQFTIGSYYIATNSKQRVDVLYHKLKMTAAQLVEKFGEDNVTDEVRIANNNDNTEHEFEVVHCLRPNSDSEKFEDFKYESVYYQPSAPDNQFLRRSGFKSKPFVVARWDIIGDGAYGDDSPGMTALGDIKMLQTMENKKLKGLAKTVDPPMNAPSTMKGKPNTIVAGGVNFIDTNIGNQAFSPTYQVALDYQNIAFEIDRIERRIQNFFFNDLFLTISAQDKPMTATEVARRHEERVMILGAALERLQSEMFDDLLTRLYDILDGFGMIPPVPDEISGKALEINYISSLAQSQKAIETTPIEQVAAYVGNLAQLNPEVLDKFDFEESVDQYSELLGTPPKIVRSDEEVAVLRQQRAEKQQAAEAMAAAQQLADTTKTLSDTEMNKNSALDGILEGQA